MGRRDQNTNVKLMKDFVLNSAFILSNTLFSFMCVCVCVDLCILMHVYVRDTRPQSYTDQPQI